MEIALESDPARRMACVIGGGVTLGVVKWSKDLFFWGEKIADELNDMLEMLKDYIFIYFWIFG